MTTAEILTLDIVEVDSREADSLIVTLLYNKTTEESWIGIYDGKTDFEEVIQVPNSQAYNAYKHPFPYLALRGVDYPLPSRKPAANESN